MKQISSLELHFLLEELEVLKNSRVDNIYNNEKEEFYFQFHKSNVGKIILKIIVGKSIFISESKESESMPSGFCQQLRKNLGGKFLMKIKQINSERIIEFKFESKNDIRKVYVEFFGSGNIILCDGKDVIINALIPHKFKDRSVLPKERYIYPQLGFNFFKITEKELIKFFGDSNKDKIVTALATGLGLGGVFSEEVCLLSGIDKNTKPLEIGDKGIKKIHSGIKNLLKNKISPFFVFEGNDLVDVIPFALKKYSEKKVKKIKTISEGLDEYYLTVKPKKALPYDKKLEELKRIIAEQEETLSQLKKKEIENKEKGELIYHKYKLIEEIITEINKASEKYSWKEIKEKLKGHEIIKEINLKDKTVVVEV